MTTPTPTPEGTLTLLRLIVEQLKLCKYTCQAGALEDNLAFIILDRLASDAIAVEDIEAVALLMEVIVNGGNLTAPLRRLT